MPFNDVSYLELWQPLFPRSKFICVVFVEVIMRNISVNNFELGPVVQEEMSF